MGGPAFGLNDHTGVPLPGNKVFGLDENTTGLKYYGTMGWMTFILGQALCTSVALGALKRQGAIVVNESKIQNDVVRTVVVQAIASGESITVFGERIWKQAVDQINSNKK